MCVYQDIQYVQLNFPFPLLLQEKQHYLKEPWSCKVKFIYVQGKDNSVPFNKLRPL